MAHVANGRVRTKKKKRKKKAKFEVRKLNSVIVFANDLPYFSFRPMLGQFGHFTVYANEKIPYTVERYRKEANRLFKVLDTQLSKNKYISSAGYPSIK